MRSFRGRSHGPWQPRSEGSETRILDSAVPAVSAAGTAGSIVMSIRSGVYFPRRRRVRPARPSPARIGVHGWGMGRMTSWKLPSWK